MARYFQFYRKGLAFLLPISKNGSYSSLHGLISTNKSFCCFSRYSRGFYSCVQLNRQENDDKIQSSFSTKQSYGNETSELHDAVKELEVNVHNGNINAAKEIYRVWNQKDGFHETDFAFLTLVNGLLKYKRIDEVKQIVTEFNSNDLKSRSTKNSDAILCRIFDSLSNYAELNDLEWFVDNLVFSRDQVNQNVLQIIIKSALWKHRDLDVTLNLFERIAHKFRVTPLSLLLTAELIKNGDTERLEKLLEIVSNMHGKINSFYDMAFAFTMCGRIDQAKRIFTSLDTVDTNKIDSFINNLKLRRKIKHLQNLLAATENCVSKECRAKIYSALLELCAYENDSNKTIANLCAAMNEEQIIPTDESVNKIIRLMKRANVEAPKSWLKNQSNENSAEEKLQALLTENKILEANEYLYNSLKSETPLQRNIIRFCLAKNAENGEITIFEQLKPKFDSHTKVQLKFYTYECEAYIKAGKSEDYMKIIRDAKNGVDLKELAVSISERVIDMIESNPSVYEEYKNIAKNLADKGVVKPICLAWIYNFINNTNISDNEMIWVKYLDRHPTIVCNQVTKILFQRKETEKLRQFLNMKDLNKKLIIKSELGKAYSYLFDSLIYKGDQDAIIEELEKAITLVSLKDLKPNTLNRIKLSSNEFSQRFWSVINNSAKIIQYKK